MCCVHCMCQDGYCKWEAINSNAQRSQNENNKRILCPSWLAQQIGKRLTFWQWTNPFLANGLKFNTPTQPSMTIFAIGTKTVLRRCPESSLWPQTKTAMRCNMNTCQSVTILVPTWEWMKKYNSRCSHALKSKRRKDTRENGSLSLSSNSLPTNISDTMILNHANFSRPR